VSCIVATGNSQFSWLSFLMPPSLCQSYHLAISSVEPGHLEVILGQ